MSELDILIEDTINNYNEMPYFLKRIKILSIELTKLEELYNSEDFKKRMKFFDMKNYHPVSDINELNEIQKKILENKVKEIEVSYNSTTASAGKTVSAGKTKTKVDYRNIVVMKVSDCLSIVEANDRGMIIGSTIILVKNSKIKFYKMETSLIKKW